MKRMLAGALMAVCTFALIGCMDSWSSAFGGPRYLEDNGHVGRARESCFMAIEADRAWWARNSRVMRDYFLGPVYFASIRSGPPEYPPVWKDNRIYLYADCTTVESLPHQWSYVPVDADEYAARLAEANA
jgi:hypothetical protein